MALALLSTAMLVIAALFLVGWIRGSFTSEANPGAVVGQRGVALDTFTAEGRVLVRGEEWKASSLRGIIERNSSVKVVGQLEGLKLLVEAIPEMTEAEISSLKGH